MDVVCSSKTWQEVLLLKICHHLGKGLCMDFTWNENMTLYDINIYHKHVCHELFAPMSAMQKEFLCWRFVCLFVVLSYGNMTI